MEKLLLRLARQLDALDEASLMALWSKYATMTSRFEPTRRWEEGALVFSLIQAKHWKNQLFNYCWRQQRLPARDDAPESGNGSAPEGMPDMPRVGLDVASAGAGGEDHLSGFVGNGRAETPRPCRVLTFRSAQRDARAGEAEDAEAESGHAPEAASGERPQAGADPELNGGTGSPGHDKGDGGPR